MKRTNALQVTLVLIFAILIISGCLSPYPARELRSAYVQIEIGVTYSEETRNAYRFTPATSGRYIISVIGTDCELSWLLLNNPNPDAKNAIVVRSISGTPGAEIPMPVVLNGGQEYYLGVVIVSKTAIKATYELSIVPK